MFNLKPKAQLNLDVSFHLTPKDPQMRAVDRSRTAAKEVLELSQQRPAVTVIEARFVQPGSALCEALTDFATGGYLAIWILHFHILMPGCDKSISLVL